MRPFRGDPVCERLVPEGLPPSQEERLGLLLRNWRRVERGQALYRAGDAFRAIYVVRSGLFKTVVVDEDGREQVMGFHMPGEIMGMEGIGSDQHTCSTLALEDAEVCMVLFGLLGKLAIEAPQLQRHLHKLMSQELVRHYTVMMLLGRMTTEERLSAFLMNISERFAARGGSPFEFVLCMTREEIGSYLGMKLETVSRAFSQFQHDGLIKVCQKHVRLINIVALQKLAQPRLASARWRPARSVA